ncbi:hypothetical protein GE118_01875 [Mycoplasma sp. NEAQ87857]|uniref:FIVAR domain-containing protein n=1 Tax=Mycoplasma sp. NEAQ87857 TaxID=2683967 RepID=UPI00131656FC|nr:FIVAR domain-containing protein [Mycoplasma sp. NEAQ87857]QGZ97544.1 hypothetical protein GE118_01875 [Mycoplasma sp. NEAQ87857]
MKRKKITKVPFMVIASTTLVASLTSVAASDSNNNQKYQDHLPTRIESNRNQQYFFTQDTINKYVTAKYSDYFTIDNTFYDFNSTYSTLFNSRFNLQNSNGKRYVRYGENGIYSYYKPDVLNNSNSQTQYLNDFNSGNLTNLTNSLLVDRVNEFNNQNKYLIVSKSNEFPDSLFRTITTRKGGAEQFVKVVRVDDGGLDAKEQTYRFEFGMQNLQDPQNVAWIGGLPDIWNTLMRMNIVWSDDFEPVTTDSQGRTQDIKVTWVAQDNNFRSNIGTKEFTFNLKHHKINFNSKNTVLGIGNNASGLPIFRRYGNSDDTLRSLYDAVYWDAGRTNLSFGYPKIVGNWRLLEQDINHTNTNGLNTGMLSAGINGQFLSQSHSYQNIYGNAANIASGIRDLNSLASTFGNALQLSWNAREIRPSDQSGTHIYIEMKFKKKDFWKPSSASRNQDASYIGATNYLTFDANVLSGQGKRGNLAVGNFWVHKRTTNRPLPVKINSYKKNSTKINFSLPIADYKYYQKDNGSLIEVQGRVKDPNQDVYNANSNNNLNEYQKSGITFHASSARDVDRVNWLNTSYGFGMLNPLEGQNFVFTAPSSISNNSRKWTISRNNFGDSNSIGFNVTELDSLDWNNVLIAISKDDKNTYKKNFFDSNNPHIFNGYEFDWNDLFKEVFSLNDYIKSNAAQLRQEDITAIVNEGNQILKDYVAEAKDKTKFNTNAIYTTNDKTTILNNDNGRYIVAPYKTDNYDSYVTKIKASFDKVDKLFDQAIHGALLALHSSYIDNDIRNQYRKKSIEAFYNKTITDQWQRRQNAFGIIVNEALKLSETAKKVLDGDGTLKGIKEIGNLIRNTSNKETLAKYKFASKENKDAFDQAFNNLTNKFTNGLLKHDAYNANGFVPNDLNSVIEHLKSDITDLNAKYNSLNGLTNLTNFDKLKRLDLFDDALKAFYIEEVYNQETLDQAKDLIRYLIDFNGDPDTNRDNVALYKAIKYLQDNTDDTIRRSNRYLYSDAEYKTEFDTLVDQKFKPLFERQDNGQYKLKIQHNPKTFKNQTSKETIDNFMDNSMVYGSLANAKQALNGESVLTNLKASIDSFNNFSSGFKNRYKNNLTSSHWQNNIWTRHGKTFNQGARDLIQELSDINELANEAKEQIARYMAIKNDVVYTLANNVAKTELNNTINRINSWLTTNINDLRSINDFIINQDLGKRTFEPLVKSLKGYIDGLNGKEVFINNKKAEIDALIHFDEIQKYNFKRRINDNDSVSDINNYVAKLQAIDAQATTTFNLMTKANHLITNVVLDQNQRNNYNNASSNLKQELRNAKAALLSNMDDSGNIKRNLTNNITTITSNGALDGARLDLEAHATRISNAINALDGNLILSNKINELDHIISLVEKSIATGKFNNNVNAYLQSSVNTAKANKIAHANSANDLTNDINALVSVINIADWKQDAINQALVKIYEAQALKTKLDANNLTVESSTLLRMINRVKDEINRAGSTANSIKEIKNNVLVKEMQLQEARLNAKLAKDKMGDGINNRVSSLVNEFPSNNILKNLLNLVDEARSQLDAIYWSTTKDIYQTINQKANLLTTKVNDARAQLVKEIDSLTNLDTTMSNAFKNYIQDPNHNLTLVVKAYSNATTIDKVFSKIKTSIPIYTENDEEKIKLSSSGEEYKTALSAVKNLISLDDKANSANSGFNNNVVTDASGYLSNIETKLNKLSTEYNKLNNLADVENAKNLFIQELKKAIEINNLIKDLNNDLTKNDSLDTEITNAISVSTNPSVIVNGSINSKDSVDTNLIVNINTKDKLTKIESFNNQLPIKTKAAADAALAEAIANAEAELNKWNTNVEYDNDQYKSSFSNNIKNSLDQAIATAKAKQTQADITDLAKVQAAIELDNAIKQAKSDAIQARLNNIKAMAKDQIDQLNYLATSAKDELKEAINNAKEDQIAHITTKANTLNKEYKKLIDVLNNLNTIAGNNFDSKEFINSSESTKNALKRAYNAVNNTSKVENINDINHLKGKSIDLDNISILIINLKTALDNLDGNNRLNSLKNTTNSEIDQLSNLTIGQKTALKNEVQNASLLSEINSVNNANASSNNTILIKAKILNNTMGDLRNTLAKVANDLIDKTASSYIDANKASQDQFDNALAKVNQILNSNYNGLNTSDINDAKNNLNQAISNLKANAKVNLVKDELTKLITLAKGIKNTNKIKDNNLVKLTNAIATAEAAKNTANTVNELNNAINDLNRILIEVKSNQYIANAKKVIQELKRLNLNDLANELEAKLANVQASLQTAVKIQEINEKLDDLDKWTNIDQKKIDAAKVLNKITNAYNNDLNNIINDQSNLALTNSINELNDVKNQVHNLIAVGNTADNIDAKVNELSTKLANALAALTKAITNKTAVPSSLISIFDSYIKDPNHTFENKLLAFNKLNQLNARDIEVKATLDKYIDAKTTDNYLLSPLELKNAFTNAKDKLNDLYQYIKSAIVNANSDLINNIDSFNNYLSKLDTYKNNLNDAWNNLIGDQVAKSEKDNANLALTRAKSQLQDLINQANNWLNNNTKATDTNLKGNLPSTTSNATNHLNDANATIESINNEINKLNESLNNANNRLNSLTDAKDQLTNIINLAENYLNTVEDSGINQKLSNAINKANDKLNTDLTNDIIQAAKDLENVLDNTKLNNELIKAKALKDQLMNDNAYLEVVNALDKAITNAKEISNQITDPISLDLKNKQKEAINNLEKAIANAKLNKTIVDAKKLINGINDDKYKDILDNLNNAITNSLIDNDIKSASEIIQDNNKLINEIAKAKFDKTMIDANDLLDKLTKDPTKNQDLIDQLNNSIQNNNNIDPNNINDVIEATKELNKALIEIKAKAVIKDATEIINNINYSSLDNNLKNQLTNKLNNLINKTNEALANNNSNDIVNTTNDLIQANKDARKEIKKAEYDNSINIAKDLSKDESSLDPLIKDTLNNEVDQIEKELNNKTKPSEKDYIDAKEKVDKAINDAVIDQTIKKVKDYINSIKDDNKYQPIVDNLNQAINNATDASNINNSTDIFDNNNKLLNDLANAKLDKAIIDANDLVSKYSNKYPNQINKIKDLINQANNIDKSNTKLVEETTKQLVKEIVNTKAKVIIDQAKAVLNDLNNSSVNSLDKSNLSNDINDLINQIDNLINDPNAKIADISNLINQLDNKINQTKDAIAKTQYLDTKQNSKLIIDNSNLSSDLKDKFNQSLDQIDTNLNSIIDPEATDYIKAKDDINNLVDKIKLEDAIAKANTDKNNLISNNDFNFLPNEIKDPIIKDITDAINQAVNILNNQPDQARDQIDTLNNKVKEQLTKANKAIKSIKDLIDQTINHINNLENLEPELINDLANKAKSFNSQSSLNKFKDNTDTLNDHHGTLINKFKQANDLANSNLFAKVSKDKQDKLTKAISFIKQNKILGKTNKGLSSNNTDINNAIDMLNKAINDVKGDQKTAKSYWYFAPIALASSLFFLIGLWIFKHKKKK